MALCLMFRLLLSHPRCAPKAQHPTLLCFWQASIQKVSRVVGIWEAQGKQTDYRLHQPPLHFLYFQLPMSYCNPKILNGNFQRERTHLLQIMLSLSSVSILYMLPACWLIANLLSLCCSCSSDVMSLHYGPKAQAKQHLVIWIGQR